MSIQQSFNQGLMGTTFLLGQVPAFKQAQQNAADLAQVKREGKALKETRGIINKMAKDDSEAGVAKKVLRKQSLEFLSGFSTSGSPKLKARAAIAKSRLMSGDPDREISNAFKREQVDEKIKDEFDTIEENRQRALDSIHNLRGQLSNRQTKKLTYKVNKKYNEQQEERIAAAYGPNE